MRAMWLMAGLLALGAGSLRAEDGEAGCPGMDAWRRDHPQFDEAAIAARDAARALTAPELLAELERRVDADQTARRGLLEHPDASGVRGRVQDLDADNVAWLRQEIRRHGYPTAAAVGERGVHLAWILLQHADEEAEFRQGLVPVLQQRLEAGELSPLDFARFIDRVAKSAGHRQRYGTQFNWRARTLSLPPAAELADIDRQRAAIGLMPLADYACAMRRSHGPPGG